MITDDRITSYIHSLAGNDSDICMQIEHEALSEGVPIIRKEMGCFLKTILAEKHPKNILEVGAAVLIEGTTTGSVTDVNGNFVLSVPSKDAVLVVSYIGMATGKVKVQPKLTITLKSE